MIILYIEDEEPVVTLTMRMFEIVIPEAEIIHYSDIPFKISQDSLDYFLSDIDYIVSDCNLPSGNICESLKGFDINIPIMLVTGDTGIECDLKDCAVCYKPYSIEDFKEGINKLRD